MPIPDRLLDEWDTARNGNPDEYKGRVLDKVWWVCKDNVCGCHIWESTINNRLLGRGCPYCASQKICVHTSLQALYPELCQEWDYIKNTKTPDIVHPGSAEKVSWICKSGACGCHRWKTDIHSRVRGTRCPYCSGRKICVHTSLISTHPELCKEWDYTRNEILPSKVSRGCNKKVWWVCKDNVCGCHVWSSTISNRANGNGCPYCSGRKICIHTSLISTHPGLCEEWDFVKNTIGPEKVTYKHSYPLYWKCKVKDSHVWEDTIYTRLKGKGCPYCNNRKTRRRPNKSVSVGDGFVKDESKKDRVKKRKIVNDEVISCKEEPSVQDPSRSSSIEEMTWDNMVCDNQSWESGIFMNADARYGEIDLWWCSAPKNSKYATFSV